jgi:hypothetical protein
MHSKDKETPVMNIIPQGDYYVWHCEWCDSRNLTLWTRFEEGKVLCGACHCRFPIPQRTAFIEHASGIL